MIDLDPQELLCLAACAEYQIALAKRQLVDHLEDDRVNGSSSYNWEIWSARRTELVQAAIDWGKTAHKLTRAV